MTTTTVASRLAAWVGRHVHPPDHPSNTCDDHYKQPPTVADRLRKGDAVAIVVAGKRLTYNEVHAIAYGVVGVFPGVWLAVGGDPTLPLWLSVGLLLTAFGVGRAPADAVKTIALKTIRREPHYFAAGYVAAFAAAAFVAGTL